MFNGGESPHKFKDMDYNKFINELEDVKKQFEQEVKRYSHHDFDVEIYVYEHYIAFSTEVMYKGDIIIIEQEVDYDGKEFSPCMIRIRQ